MAPSHTHNSYHLPPIEWFREDVIGTRTQHLGPEGVICMPGYYQDGRDNRQVARANQQIVPSPIWEFPLTKNDGRHLLLKTLDSIFQRICMLNLPAGVLEDLSDCREVGRMGTNDQYGNFFSVDRGGVKFLRGR